MAGFEVSTEGGSSQSVGWTRKKWFRRAAVAGGILVVIAPRGRPGRASGESNLSAGAPAHPEAVNHGAGNGPRLRQADLGCGPGLYPSRRPNAIDVEKPNDQPIVIMGTGIPAVCAIIDKLVDIAYNAPTSR